MSLHSVSTLRIRKVQRFTQTAVTFGAMLLLFLAMTQRVALAQTVPPPANANALAATINEDGATAALDTGIQADPRYAVTITSAPAHGSVTTGGTFPGNFTITYTPGANQSGTVTFSYQICTLPPATSSPTCGTGANVTVTINPVNDPPQAISDSATVQYGQNILIDVLLNDTNGPGETGQPTLVAGGVGTPTDGSAVIENSKIRYTAPAAPAVCTGKTASFTYTVTDGSLQTVGTVAVTLTCAPAPPPAVAPKISVSALRALSNHLVEADVLLTSPSVDVAAVDFVLNYNNACVTDPDTPSNSHIGYKPVDDDITSTLETSGFYFDAQDAPFPGKLHFIAAKVLNPDFLAGPSQTSRILATIKFKALPGCATTAFTFDANPIFTGDAGTNLATGTAENKPTAALPTVINNKPANLALNNQTVAGSAVNGAYIGMFTATDPDAGDILTYTFTAPNNNAGGLFKLGANPWDKDELSLTGAVPAAGTYSITVKVNDDYSAFITKTFAIVVTPINANAPVAVNDGPLTVQGRTVFTSSILGNDTDNGAVCTACTVQSVTNGSKGVVTNLGTGVAYVPTDAKFFGTDVFSYTVSDNDPVGAKVSNIARVTVNVTNTVKLGDCNGSGTVEAGDLTATGLEIFDGDGNAWYDIYKGSRTTFKAYGCNSNQDTVLDAGDISCTARRIFGQTCGAVVAAGSSKATLEVAGGLHVAPSSSVKVPVLLRGNGNAADTAVFALSFDPAKFSFNADADAVSLSSGTLTMVNYDAAAGRVEIVVSGMTATDGEIAAIRLTASDSASGDAAISLADSSLGNEGATVAVETADGSVQIGAVYRIFVPSIWK